MPTAPALDALAQNYVQQAQALARAVEPIRQQAQALAQQFAQTQRTLDAAGSFLACIESETAQNLEHLRAESRSIATDNSDLARRVDALLRTARTRSKTFLHLVSAALTGDGAAAQELGYLASTGDALAACALALAHELDALTERVRVLVEQITQALTAHALAALTDSDAAPPPRNRLVGAVEPNSPPREPVCVSEAVRRGHSLDFPARKDTAAT